MHAWMGVVNSKYSPLYQASNLFLNSYNRTLDNYQIRTRRISNPYAPIYRLFLDIGRNAGICMGLLHIRYHPSLLSSAACAGI